MFGRTKFERYVDEDGRPDPPPGPAREEWQVLIEDHHRGYVDWETYQANTGRSPPTPAWCATCRHRAVREGCALLQGLAACGVCGRKLAVFYDGPSKSTPGYYCAGTGAGSSTAGSSTPAGRGRCHRNRRHRCVPGGARPAALYACLAAVERTRGDGHDTVLTGHRREVERSRYDAARAERRYGAVDPDNRLVARGLEAAWERPSRRGPPRRNSPGGRNAALRR